MCLTKHVFKKSMKWGCTCHGNTCLPLSVSKFWEEGHTFRGSALGPKESQETLPQLPQALLPVHSMVLLGPPFLTSMLDDDEHTQLSWAWLAGSPELGSLGAIVTCHNEGLCEASGQAGHPDRGFLNHSLRNRPQ